MRGVPRAAAMLQCFHATSHCHHVWYDNPHLTQHTQASEPSTRTPHARRNSILARAAHTPARPRTMSLVLLHSAPAAGAVAGLRRRRGGAAVVRAASTSPLDRLQGASTLESVLNLADDELQELCSMRGTPEQQAECWEVRLCAAAACARRTSSRKFGRSVLSVFMGCACEDRGVCEVK
jgi:hypothetical protein